MIAICVLSNILSLIGNTPVVQLSNYSKSKNIHAKILGKLESKNPVGSIKDRVAYAMIKDAETFGTLKQGYTIIEPTSGNTGIALAAIGAFKGYNVVLTMPETMSVERQNLIKSYGAQVVLTDGASGMNGAIQKAQEILNSSENAIMPQQFKNKANPYVHKKTTGPEIWKDTNGQVDVLVCGVGTGGTITGAGEYLKSMNKDVKIIAVEPSASPVLSKGRSGPHKIQGIGAGFVPEILDTNIYDDVVCIDYENALESRKWLAAKEGLFVGISSGAALAAAEKISKKDEYKNKNIVVILPDSGERYLSID